MCKNFMENIIRCSYKTKNKPKYMVSCAISMNGDVKHHKVINFIQIIDIVSGISNKIPTRFFPYNSVYFF